MTKNNTLFIQDKNGKIIYTRKSPLTPFRRLGWGGFVEGTIGAAPSAISTGAMIGGPWGAAAGAAYALGSGIFGAISENKADREREEAIAKAERETARRQRQINREADETQLRSYPNLGTGTNGYYAKGGEIDGDNTNVAKYPIEMKMLADRIAKERAEVKALPGYGMSGAVDLDNTPWIPAMGAAASMRMGARFLPAIIDELTMGTRNLAKKAVPKQTQKTLMNKYLDDIAVSNTQRGQKGAFKDVNPQAWTNVDSRGNMSTRTLTRDVAEDAKIYNEIGDIGIHPSEKAILDDWFTDEYSVYKMLKEKNNTPFYNAKGGIIRPRFAIGGQLPGGGVQPMSQNAGMVIGDTHNQDTNKDGQTGVMYKGNEVEEGEVIYGTQGGKELVFSKRLGFADKVAPLVATKGKLEKQLGSLDPIKRNTAKRNIDKLDTDILAIFDQQEAVNNIPVQDYGSAPKMYGGGEVDPYASIRNKPIKAPLLDVNHNLINNYPAYAPTHVFNYASERTGQMTNQPFFAPPINYNTPGFTLGNPNQPFASRALNKLRSRIPDDTYGRYGANTRPYMRSQDPVTRNFNSPIDPLAPYTPSLSPSTGVSANPPQGKERIQGATTPSNIQGTQGPNPIEKLVTPVEYKDSPIEINEDLELGKAMNIKKFNRMKSGEKVPWEGIAQAAIPIANWVTNRNYLNKLPRDVPKPLQYKAHRLNTDVDVSAQLNEIDNQINAASTDIDRNTSNSNTALSRKMALKLRGSQMKNQIRGQEIEAERTLENMDRQNVQQIENLNVVAGNDWQDRQFTHTMGREAAFNRTNNALFQSAQNILTNIEKGNYQEEQLGLIAQQFGLDITGKTPQQIYQMFIKLLGQSLNS